MTDIADVFISRLRHCSTLSETDETRARSLVRDARPVGAYQDLKSQGDEPTSVHVVLSGLACRAKLLPDGRRQIIAFLIPGDPCDFQVFLLSRMDHNLLTLSDSTIATVSRQAIESAVAECPGLARAFWFSTLLDEAILREWLLNVGRRDAYERISHLLWELYLRHLVVDLVEERTFVLPVTQSEIADALSLSTVYVNRTLQRLRATGVIEIGAGRVRVLQPAELRRIAGFDDDYLNFGRDEHLPMELRDAAG